MYNNLDAFNNNLEERRSSIPSQNLRHTSHTVPIYLQKHRNQAQIREAHLLFTIIIQKCHGQTQPEMANFFISMGFCHPSKPNIY